MSERCKAFFAGIEVQVAASMTRSPGVVPDVGSLTWRAGTTQPGMFGNLVFKNGDTTVVTFYDCILDDPRSTYGGTRDFTYQVKDRRWRWQWPTIFGEYNIRDEANNLIAGREKNPRELATLLLDALGETGYDVSVLPTDAELAPYVAWHYAKAAEALQALCDYMGCEVHLLNNNTVKIVTAGSGTAPNNTGLELPVETGIVVNPAPDNVTAYAGDTLFDDWLLLEACGMEIDGTVKALPLLSYMPSGGWTGWDPDDVTGQEIYESLPGGMAEREKQATVEVALQSVFRMFRVVGFSAGKTKPPGMPNDYEIPEEYSRTQGAADNVQIFDPKTFNVATTNTSQTFDSADDAFEWLQTNEGNIESDDVIIGRESHELFDGRLVLPLEPTRLLTSKNMFGQDERRPAELWGAFETEKDDTPYRNVPISLIRPWLYGFSINTQKGYVFTSRPCFFINSDNKTVPPLLYLRTGFRWREEPHGSRYHRNYTLATGNSLGTANGVVPRTDVQVIAIRAYTDEFKPNNGGIASTTVTNTTAVDTALQKAATEFIKTFQAYIAPERKQYTPLRAIDTNGKVQQVQYMTGSGTFGRTIAAIGYQSDFGQPTSAQKLQRYREKENSMQNSRNFTKNYDLRPTVQAVAIQTSPWRD